MEPSEKHYEQAYAELESEEPKPGLYAKCLAEQMGDVDKARAVYIKVRATQYAAMPAGKDEEFNQIVSEGFSGKVPADDKAAARSASHAGFHMGTFGVGLIVSVLCVAAGYVYTVMRFSVVAPTMTVNEFQHTCLMLVPIIIGFSIAFWMNASLTAVRWHHKIWVYVAWIVICALYYCFVPPSMQGAYVLGQAGGIAVIVAALCATTYPILSRVRMMLAKRLRNSITNFLVSSARYTIISIAFYVLLAWR